MLNQRLAAARTVKIEFLAAEAAQDEAAIQVTRAVLAMLEARKSTNVPLGTGLKEIHLAARAAALSIEARQALIEAHPGLAALPAEVGLARMYGDVDKCPPIDLPRGEQSEPLRVVA